ncbi:alpha/beta-hydrolase [Auriscalpium vulgare]|uniref:Alpha/beta-hydrolase n=1 Tax=Auriscalpium vulgare TaxID=40419 RepID=A0ACB8S8M5_9AGAM|nr:alpha/beta-hydrolase [Auriscalpium vulgare]
MSGPSDTTSNLLPATLGEPAPLVIVEGFLGGVGETVWGHFQHYLNAEDDAAGSTRRRVIFANVGPVSSLHDRACELFYALTGGTVDYGAEHSTSNEHGRYGRAHPHGLYEAWSVTRPLHFLGHSVGGSTIVKLQHLISSGFFGRTHHPDMLLSLTSVSSPFRGTQIVYPLGEHETAAPAVRALSVGAALAQCVYAAAYLAPVLARVVDVRAEARALSFREASPAAAWACGWAQSRDAAPFDVTFEAADARAAAGEGAVHARTYYRSYAACMTEKCAEGETHRPSWRSLWSLPLQYGASLIGSYDFSVLRPIPSFLFPRPDDSSTMPPPFPSRERERDLESDIPAARLTEEYWANDGVVPVFSQWHPLECRSTRCHHHTKTTSVEKQAPHPGVWQKQAPHPGVWQVHLLEDAHHLSVMPVWVASRRQKEFWADIGAWLRDIDLLTT